MKRSFTLTSLFLLLLTALPAPAQQTVTFSFISMSSQYGAPASTDTLLYDDVLNLEAVTLTHFRNVQYTCYANYGTLRIYRGGECDISVPDGYAITRIELRYTSFNKPFTADGTTLTMVRKNWFAWTGSARKISLGNPNDGTSWSAIDSLCVTYAPQPYSLTLTSAGYATFYYGAATTLPDGLTAAAVTAGTDLQSAEVNYLYEAGDVIPPYTPVLVKGEAGTYTLSPTTDDATAPAENDLRGTTTDSITTGGTTYYKLALGSADDASTVGFYWGAADGAAFTNQAHRAYLPLATAGGAKSLIIIAPGTTTGLKQANETDAANARPLYTLQGRRVSRPTAPGIYLQDRHKVLRLP